MEIAGTIIDDHEIIGIGNLVSKEKEVMHGMSSFKWYEFEVITKQNKVLVKSDEWFMTSMDTEETKKDRARKALNFQMLYIKAYKQICDAFNEKVYPKYITQMEADVKQLWIKYKLDQQAKEN